MDLALRRKVVVDRDMDPGLYSPENREKLPVLRKLQPLPGSRRLSGDKGPIAQEQGWDRPEKNRMSDRKSRCRRRAMAEETNSGGWWRRRRDSNPRDPFGSAPLAGACLRPLGHVSASPFIGERDEGQAESFRPRFCRHWRIAWCLFRSPATARHFFSSACPFRLALPPRLMTAFGAAPTAAKDLVA